MSETLITSEQLSFYQLFSEKKYNIIIPIIQRDFAYGRTSEKNKRIEFLSTLYTYLNEGEPFRDLDFVYGDIGEQNDLIPLDGQQRLTILLLLHWYLSINDGFFEHFKNFIYHSNKSKFTYKTRAYSSDFCNALVANSLNLNNLLDPDENENNSLSKTIKDSPWYFLSWKKDSTVCSMLQMLDDIHNIFSNTEGFYKKLTDNVRPVITFRFLPLKNYGLSDDLYIKMNSRGKPLTKFENFKARFEQHLSTEKFNTLKYKINIDDKESLTNAHVYFSHQIDNQWIKLFWNFKIKLEKVEEGETVVDYEIDSLIMNFIGTIAINHAALSYNEIRTLIENQNSLPYSFFTGLDADFTNTLISTLDIFSASSKLQTFFVNNHYYQELRSFENIIHKNFSDAAYLERIQFYAYYSYLVYNSSAEGLEEWMRVICNLSNNSMPYNVDTEFINSIRAIKALLPKSKSILNHLKSEDSLNLRGFNQTQIKEEKIKAHLITKNEKWKFSILENEKHPYFKGQLTYALAFSGIESFYDQNQSCNWSEAEDEKYITLFDSYLAKVLPLFADSGLAKEAIVNHRLHRAVLSKGNYLVNAKSNSSFLNDSHRDVSWKRFLQGDGERKNKREYFKAVIDDQLYNVNDFDSLEKIAKNQIDKTDLWRQWFIQFPQVFDHLGSYKFIRFNGGGVIHLLRGERLNGEHSELYSLGIFHKLVNDDYFQNPHPFKALKYYPPSGDWRPCFYLDKWEVNGYDFALDGYYHSDGQISFKFFNRKSADIPDNIKQTLKNNGFEEDNSSSLIRTVNNQDVRETLIELCEELKKISISVVE